MHITFSNAPIPAAVLRRAQRVLDPYRARLKAIAAQPGYFEPESFVRLPHDPDVLNASRAMLRRMCKRPPELVVLVGIGGSSLGAKAVHDSQVILRHPRIVFAETVDAEFMDALRRVLRSFRKHSDRVLINVVSKSGSTTETNVLAELAHRALGTTRRTVVTTDAGSMLSRRGLPTLSIPSPVGGRYSVFSNVGLFPLLAAGFDVRGLLSGARDGLADPKFTTRSAVARFAAYGHRERIHDLFLFHPELESLGKWWRQLVAESLGKDGKGITPTVSIGSTDLHSMAQLYLGGPKDKFTTFVTTRDLSSPSKRGRIKVGDPTIVMSAIYRGTTAAYRKRGLPFTEIVLDDLSERSLGQFMQFAMLEVVLLGKLLGVDAFDQPAVEFYKRETHRLLKMAA